MQFEDLLKIEVPQDSFAAVKSFTRILARGALEDWWDSEFYYVEHIDGQSIYPNDEHRDLVDYALVYPQWREHLPRFSVFLSLGYFESIPKTAKSNQCYILTPKAFALLDEPPAASIFISYRRDESSVFALLVLARLKEALGETPFLDVRSILPGDDWHATLEDEVKTRENFVCLVGPSTLDDSSFVPQEIEWALEAGARTIPIWHNEFKERDVSKYPDHIQTFLRRNAIIVEGNHAKAYDNAIRDLLIYFGITSI